MFRAEYDEQRHLEADEPLQDEWTWHRRAEADYEGMVKHLKRAKKRRYGPPWGLPVELLSMLMPPEHCPRRPRAGLGASGTDSLPMVRDCVHRMSVRIRRTMWTPISWHRARSFVLAKPNLKMGCARHRPIHTFGAEVGAFFSSLLRRAKAPSPRFYDYGSIPGMVREGAIMVQAMAVWRCRQAQRNVVVSVFDAANAFGCSSHADLNASSQSMSERLDAYHLDDHRRYNGFTMADQHGGERTFFPATVLFCSRWSGPMCERGW